MNMKLNCQKFLELQVEDIALVKSRRYSMRCTMYAVSVHIYRLVNHNIVQNLTMLELKRKLGLQYKRDSNITSHWRQVNKLKPRDTIGEEN